MSQENQNNQNNQNENSKVGKQFEETISKLTAVLGGKKLEISTKVPNNKVSDIVETLFKEESEQAYEDLKNNLKDLLKAHVNLKKEISKKEQELKNLEIQKQKEFIQKANDIFKSIENINQLHTDYMDSLKVATENNE